jgi:hypothetical protein
MCSLHLQGRTQAHSRSRCQNGKSSRRERGGRVVAGHRWVLSRVVERVIGEGARRGLVYCAGRVGDRSRSFEEAGMGVEGEGDFDFGCSFGCDFGLGGVRLLAKGVRCRNGGCGSPGVGALRRMGFAGVRWIQGREEGHRLVLRVVALGGRGEVFGCFDWVPGNGWNGLSPIHSWSLSSAQPEEALARAHWEQGRFKYLFWLGMSVGFLMLATVGFNLSYHGRGTHAGSASGL